jgi:mRNA interferase MazF
VKRGDLVLIRQSGTPTAKPRPCVVVQRNSALGIAGKVSVCPLTSQLRGTAGHRPFVAPHEENGLRVPSEVQVDWIYTHATEYLGPVIGRIDTATMEQIDIALRRWLDL